MMETWFINSAATSALFHRAAQVVGSLVAQEGALRKKHLQAALDGLIERCRDADCGAMPGDYHDLTCAHAPARRDPETGLLAHVTFTGRWSDAELPAVKTLIRVMLVLVDLSRGLAPAADDQLQLLGEVVVPPVPRGGGKLTRKTLALAQERLRVFAGPQSVESRSLFTTAADALEAAIPRLLKFDATVHAVAKQVMDPVFAGPQKHAYDTVTEITDCFDLESTRGTQSSLAASVARLRRAAARPTIDDAEPVIAERTFRCTRPDLYRAGTVGHTNPSARQGHCIEATNERDAVRQMAESYPNDSAFDVQSEEPWATSPARRHLR